MSLLDEIRKYTDEGDLPYTRDITLVERELLDERRWYDRFLAVYHRDGEYVGVEYNEPATEMQEIELEAEVFSVRPVQVTVTKYERV